MNKIEIRSIDDLDPLQRLCLTDFSYSRLDTYKMCPSKYFYTYIQKEPRSFNDAAVLGNIVHSVLEECLSDETPLDQEALHLEYSKQKESYDPSGIISEDLIDVGSVILDEFYDKHSDEKFNIYEKELGFSFVIGNYLINGYIDRVDFYDEDTINIIDYKTGKWEVTQKGLHQNLQLGIYALALSNVFPDKNIRAELYYLRSGKRKSHTFTKEDIEDVKVRLLSDIEKVVNDTSFGPTGNERVCGFCEHAKSKACPTGYARLKRMNRI
jgi:DNA helicase-2/ATP-dependent DNA helicase PcrA